MINRYRIVDVNEIEITSLDSRNVALIRASNEAIARGTWVTVVDSHTNKIVTYGRYGKALNV